MTVLDSSKPIFRYFEDLTLIPHGSKNEQAISHYLMNFASEHSLKAIQDDMFNVIMYKPASKGKESIPPVMLQAHMDMVCEKTADTDFDFTKDALNLVVEDGWLHATGTTLGADDGVGVAYILAILSDETISHPAIEAVFTVQEEIGLCGAKNLKPEYFHATTLINLDGGSEAHTCVSNSGGMRCGATTTIHRVNVTQPVYEITIGGLLGGHSGGLIQKNRGNAIKLLTRALWNLLSEENTPFQLVSFEGGLKENAIPRDAVAIITTDAPVEVLNASLNRTLVELQEEYATTDPDVQFTLTPSSATTCMDEPSTWNVLRFLYLTPNGLQDMSTEIPDLPIVSLNLGIVNTTEETVDFMFSVRSPIESRKKDLYCRIKAVGALTNTEVSISNNYGGWNYEKNSPLREVLRKTTQEVFGCALTEDASHGGLETGILKAILPELDIITICPISEGCHTPDERLNLKSFETCYRWLVKTVEAIQ